MSNEVEELRRRLEAAQAQIDKYQAVWKLLENECQNRIREGCDCDQCYFGREILRLLEGVK